MKKSFLFVLFLVFACNSNSSNGEIIATKEEKIIKIYNKSLLPLFKTYSNVDIPTEFRIDKNDLSVDAGAAFGYVEVSQGLVNLTKEDIQLFALAHEVAHIVTISQARLFGLQGSIPKGTVTNDYKKAEYLADLIAIHLIKIKLTKEFNLLITDFPFLENLLGAGNYTHPSGSDRIDYLNIYLKNSIVKGDDDAFKVSFLRIWQME